MIIWQISMFHWQVITMKSPWNYTWTTSWSLWPQHSVLFVCILLYMSLNQGIQTPGPGANSGTGPPPTPTFAVQYNTYTLMFLFLPMYLWGYTVEIWFNTQERANYTIFPDFSLFYVFSKTMLKWFILVMYSRLGCL